MPPLALLAFSRVNVTDDAYISYRYAYNLVEGRGLVFNSGERVEGFTNLLWTLMMTVPESLGLPVHLFAAFLGIALGLLALIDTWRICNRLGVSSLGTTAATVALGLYPDFWLAVASGLEGGLLAFLLMRIVYLVLSGRYVYAGLFCGLLFATRPDALPVGVICALYALVAPENRTLSLRQRLARRAGPLLCAWLALVVAITVWRLSYYGAWLPNTILAKSVPPESLDSYQVVSNAYAGLRYWISFALSAAPLTLGAVLALVLARERLAVWLCLSLLAAQVPVIWASGGDWMPYHRLLAVYAPLLAVALGIAVDRITESGFLPLRWTTGLSAGLFVAAMTVMLLHSQEHHWDDWDATPDIAIGKPLPCYSTAADAMQPVLTVEDRVAVDSTGLFTYMLPNVYFTEITGLTDRYIAQHGTVYVRSFGKRAPGYLYHTVRPNLILVHEEVILSEMVRASKGTYNGEYATYSLTGLPGLDSPVCPWHSLEISIRKDSVKRILPTLASFKPQPVTVPSQEEEQRQRSIWRKALELL